MRFEYLIVIVSGDPSVKGSFPLNRIEIIEPLPADVFPEFPYVIQVNFNIREEMLDIFSRTHCAIGWRRRRSFIFVC